ncbi:MAG: VOC family protein [Brevibacterium sp.]|uniref:VOC family protein n=1 Tax=Brevibacterium sp. TaxID=1701 RepID=UPI003F929716
MRRRVQVTFDCHDPVKTARFWAPGLEGEERMEALEAECVRLSELGGHRLRRVAPDPPMEQGFIIMADPEGNEFCLD